MIPHTTHALLQGDFILGCSTLAGGLFSVVSEDPGEKKSEWEPYVSPKTSMTMEKQQFEDVSPVLNMVFF